MKTKLVNGMRLGVIGAGNMAGAILSGALKQGALTPELLSVSDSHSEKLADYARAGAFITTDNVEIARRSELILLAIKPQMFETVLPELSTHVEGKCVLSISPGWSVATLKAMLPGAYILRAMPNTPLLVGKGVTAFAQAPDVPDAYFEMARRLFSSSGDVVTVPESLMDAVIAVSGSSPAYFFRMADAMVEGARALGMEPELALRMAAETMAGAAEMLLRSDKTARELTVQVCSPGGTTLAAMAVLDDRGFNATMGEAMERCARRSAELGK